MAGEEEGLERRGHQSDPPQVWFSFSPPAGLVQTPLSSPLPLNQKGVGSTSFETVEPKGVWFNPPFKPKVFKKEDETTFSKCSGLVETKRCWFKPFF